MVELFWSHDTHCKLINDIILQKFSLALINYKKLYRMGDKSNCERINSVKNIWRKNTIQSQRCNDSFCQCLGYELHLPDEIKWEKYIYSNLIFKYVFLNHYSLVCGLDIHSQHVVGLRCEGINILGHFHRKKKWSTRIIWRKHLMWILLMVLFRVPSRNVLQVC